MARALVFPGQGAQYVGMGLELAQKHPVARDLLDQADRALGFGLSDKPEDEKAYSLQRHVLQMTQLIEHLELRELTVVGQDWGGPITLRYAIKHKDNIRALALLDTFIERFPANGRERRELDIITRPLPPGFTGLIGELLNDPPGFDRGVLPEVDRKITAFFSRHLLR